MLRVSSPLVKGLIFTPKKPKWSLLSFTLSNSFSKVAKSKEIQNMKILDKHNHISKNKIPLEDLYKIDKFDGDSMSLVKDDVEEVGINESSLKVLDADDFTTVELASIQNIPPLLKDVLTKQHHFKYATKIQHEVFTRMPIKKDIKAQANTGSGKTLAYLIPSIEIMVRCLSPEETAKGKQVSVLILAPTRELVIQVSSEAKKLLRKMPFQVLPFIGGTSRKEDLNRIITKRVDVIVATPGRIIDLITSSAVFRSQLEELKVLVLDEADELMKHGFAQNLSAVLNNLPKNRQTMMFSATMNEELEKTIVKKAFKDISNIHDINTCTLSPQQRLALQLPKIDQRVAYVSYNMHLHLLYAIIRQSPSSKIILFLPTVLSVQLTAGLFRELGFYVYEMHSLLNQKERVEVTSKFRGVPKGILVTTDVSARGMDYPDVDLVLQWGVPSSVTTYMHRIGRTGRAGRSGKSILIVSPLEERFLRLLEDEGISFSIVDVEKEIQKPPSEEIHTLNKMCTRIKPGIVRQLFRTTLTHSNQLHFAFANNLDLTMCALLGTSRKQAHSQTKKFIIGLGHAPPSLDWKHLTPDIKQALADVDRAKVLISRMKRAS